jgi:hypothetical protein
MWQDPIVAEIHQAREEIAKIYGNDLHAIFEAAQRGDLSARSVSLQRVNNQQGASAGCGDVSPKENGD